LVSYPTAFPALEVLGLYQSSAARTRRAQRSRLKINKDFRYEREDNLDTRILTEVSDRACEGVGACAKLK